MPFFIVTLTHPEGSGWDKHFAAHARYLKGLVQTGALRASGPFKGTQKRSGLLIFKAATRDQVEALIAGDPFATEGLIESHTIIEWDPLFGAFATESSGKVPGHGPV